MLDWFEYKGIQSYQFGIITTGLRTYGAPNRRVETVHVPGRNGDLLIDEGTFDNIIVSYDIAIIQDFEINARDIAEWLLSDSGYFELTDTYNPELYREATYFNAIEFDVEALRHQGKGTISFYAKPQRYLPSELLQLRGNTTNTLTNPTGFTARPLIVVTGAMTIAFGDQTIVITDVVDSAVFIDSETMQCYSGDVNCNDLVQMDEFPVIPPYETVTITITGSNFNKTATFTPRYWRL